MMFILTFIALLATTFYIETKIPTLQLTMKKRLLLLGVGTVFYPVTLTLGAIAGASLIYHKKVKALPFVESAVKRLPNKGNL